MRAAKESSNDILTCTKQSQNIHNVNNKKKEIKTEMHNNNINDILAYFFCFYNFLWHYNRNWFGFVRKWRLFYLFTYLTGNRRCMWSILMCTLPQRKYQLSPPHNIHSYTFTWWYSIKTKLIVIIQMKIPHMWLNITNFKYVKNIFLKLSIFKHVFMLKKWFSLCEADKL